MSGVVPPLPAINLTGHDLMTARTAIDLARATEGTVVGDAAQVPPARNEGFDFWPRPGPRPDLGPQYTPAERKVLQGVARHQGLQAAERMGTPAGLRDLFPTNLVRWKARKVAAAATPSPEPAEGATGPEAASPTPSDAQEDSHER